MGEEPTQFQTKNPLYPEVNYGASFGILSSRNCFPLLLWYLSLLTISCLCISMLRVPFVRDSFLIRKCHRRTEIPSFSDLGNKTVLLASPYDWRAGGIFETNILMLGGKLPP